MIRVRPAGPVPGTGAGAPAPEINPVPAPEPAPVPAGLARLGPQRVVQPLWSADGSRVLFYDQPAPGQGGTWAVDPASGEVTRERPEWGHYVAQGTLLATPRPVQRDTQVLHISSGRRWSLPTTGPTLFSPDGTVVAYSAGSLVVAGADDQGARRIQLPVNGTPLAWLPAPDRTPNARLLLLGRRGGDEPGLWTVDLRDRRALYLGRARRLTGVLPSPDGTWVAHVALWNADPSENGLWVTRTDGSLRRRVTFMGSYRWTQGNRLLVLPVRSSPSDGHEVWEVHPDSGATRRLVDPSQALFRVANCDWECSPDGKELVFVSADDKSLWQLTLPGGQPPGQPPGNDGAEPPKIWEPANAGTNGRPYRLPFAEPPGPSTWYVSQWYGVTTGGYRWRVTSYAQGQGIHFGIDFSAPCGTPVVAVAPGRVIAIDGDYGSPLHNVVLALFDGNIAMYGHLLERTQHVEVGQTVQAGQVVGRTGDSLPPYNCTRNPHLHFEIRKAGRAVATNPVPYFDANWDDMSLGVWQGAQFERDMDNPRRYQFLDEQPDIRFGGPIITNFSRPWPP